MAHFALPPGVFRLRDPGTYAEPWGALLPLERFDDLLYEYACHEGNYALANVLSGARYEERLQNEGSASSRDGN